MKIKFYKYIVLLIIISSLFTSCKSLKQTFEKYISNSKPDQLIDELVSNNIDYNNIYLRKISFNFNDGYSKKSFRGSIYIEKNKNIIISITPILGIELFKVIMDPKSITIVDKMNKNIRYADYSYVEKHFGFYLDYKIIESILSNHFFTYPVDLPSRIVKFTIKESSDFYEIIESNTHKYKNDNYLQNIKINTEFNKLNNHKINNLSKNLMLNIQYSNFKDLKSNHLYPYNINLNAISKNQNVIIDMQSSQIELNSKNSLSTSIPSGYEKIYY